MTVVDKRGWTFLHIAAIEGRVTLERRVLDLGADPKAVGLPSWSYVPASIHITRITSRKAAAADGDRVEARYVRILEQSAKRQMTEVSLSTALQKRKDEQFLDARERFV